LQYFFILSIENSRIIKLVHILGNKYQETVTKHLYRHSGSLSKQKELNQTSHSQQSGQRYPNMWISCIHHNIRN